MMINKYFKLHINQANSYRKKIWELLSLKELIAMVLILVLGFLVSCSSTPIVDSRVNRQRILKAI